MSAKMAKKPSTLPTAAPGMMFVVLALLLLVTGEPVVGAAVGLATAMTVGAATEAAG